MNEDLSSIPSTFIKRLVPWYTMVALRRWKQECLWALLSSQSSQICELGIQWEALFYKTNMESNWRKQSVLTSAPTSQTCTKDIYHKLLRTEIISPTQCIVSRVNDYLTACILWHFLKNLLCTSSLCFTCFFVLAIPPMALQTKTTDLYTKCYGWGK